MASLKLFTTFKSSNRTVTINTVQRSLFQKNLKNQKRFYAILSSVHSDFSQELSSSDLMKKCGMYALTTVYC